MGLINSVIHEDGISPISARRLYTSIAFPRALYGCEVWSDLKCQDLRVIEIAHRFAAKYVQGFSTRTRTDTALGLIGLPQVEAFIDQRKLNLCGQLCRLRVGSAIKSVFLLRLSSYTVGLTEQKGSIPDFFRLLYKYGLNEAIVVYLSDGTLPDKLQWKWMVKQAVSTYHEIQWKNRLESCISFSRLEAVHSELKPCLLWQACLIYPKDAMKFKATAKVLASLSADVDLSACSKCGKSVSCLVDHILVECTVMNSLRDKFWFDIIDWYGGPLYVYLDN